MTPMLGIVGTGDVASKRGGKKFADTLKEKERKIVELDNLRHSEFMEAYVANNPADTIQVAKRAKGNQVKGDAARSARYQKYRPVAELKGYETLSAVSGTDAVHYGLENEHQYPMAQPLSYNSSQDWSGRTLTGGGQNTSYTPRLPPPTPAEEQAFADSLRMLKKRCTEDNNAEVFGIIRPDRIAPLAKWAQSFRTRSDARPDRLWVRLESKEELAITLMTTRSHPLTPSLPR